MKFPNFPIYWEVIASNYLQILDLARIEAALTNHELRDKLGIGYYDTASSQCWTTMKSSSNPYMNHLQFNKSKMQSIKNDNDYVWCVRRGLKIPHLNLLYDKLPRSDEFPVDVMHHVETLNLLNCDTNYFTDVLARTPLLSSFSHKHLAPADVHILASINGSALSFRASNITSLRFYTRYCSEIAVNQFLSMMVNLTTIEIMDDDKITDANMHHLASCLKHLASMYTSGSCVSDNGFAAFRNTGQSFTSIKVFYNLTITGIGLNSLLSHSSASLTELSLVDVPYILESHIIDALQHLPQLHMLNLYSSIYHHDQPYTDSLFHAIGSNCPNLRIFHAIPTRQITDDGFEALIKGCKHIEKLNLGYCSLLTISRFADAYQRSLKQLSCYCNDVVDEKRLFPDVQKLSFLVPSGGRSRHI